MLADFDTRLDRYAELAVRVGLNLQPGQRLLIGSPMLEGFTPLEALPLVRRIAAHAYQAGSPLVDVIWGDQQLQRVRLENAPPGSFSEIAHWPVDAVREFIEQGGALLLIYGQDPDLFAGYDSQAVSALQQASARRSEPLISFVARNVMNWLVIAAPVPGWADKLFPGLPAADQTHRLWEALFEVCRLNQPDALEAWQNHIQELQARSSYLNTRRYAALHFSAPGTVLTVRLPEGHLWQSGQLTSQRGIPFIANLPTEEIFTLPHKDGVDGVVTSTRPLAFGGALVEGIRLTFKDGQVVEAQAERGEDFLKQLLETDAGANRLGEVALVPHSSPISASELLFYNILIDENAANHLALGQAYQFSLESGQALSAAEFSARGGNQSNLHVDFMIGSGEMNVDGETAEGAQEPVMRRGEWAFEV